MNAITVKDISLGLTLIVGLLTSTTYINKTLKEWISKMFNEKVEPFNTKLNELDEKITKVDLDTCKNYLSRCLADFEKGNQLSDVELERFWEQYEHYIENGGNSYIKHRVEKLQQENKL